jgi:hypothetical protein
MKNTFLFPLTELAHWSVKRGMQIVYVPGHIQEQFRDGKTGEINAAALDEKDTQFGFVTSVGGRMGCFCRYWRSRHSTELRTKANSELTPWKYLFLLEEKDPATIVIALKEYC